MQNDQKILTVAPWEDDTVSGRDVITKECILQDQKNKIYRFHMRLQLEDSLPQKRENANAK